MEDNIQEMYVKARKAFREVEYWPQEKVDEMVQAVAWELLKEDVRHKLGHGRGVIGRGHGAADRGKRRRCRASG